MRGLPQYGGGISAWQCSVRWEKMQEMFVRKDIFLMSEGALCHILGSVFKRPWRVVPIGRQKKG